MTQDMRVIEHLKNFNSITSMEAIQLYGITRLAAVMARVKKILPITSTIECGKNRFGDKTHWTRYSLKEE